MGLSTVLHLKHHPKTNILNFLNLMIVQQASIMSSFQKERRKQALFTWERFPRQWCTAIKVLWNLC